MSAPIKLHPAYDNVQSVLNAYPHMSRAEAYRVLEALRQQALRRIKMQQALRGG